MKIQLTNFKSWRNHSFEFGDQSCTLISGASGQGKCFSAGTMIRMHSGQQICVESVQTGDLVMGWDSKPRTVLGTTTGTEQLFNIQCFSTTNRSVASYTVNASHILTLLNKKGLVIDIPISEYLSSPLTQYDYRGFRAVVQYPKLPIPFDPYLYGVLVGGGPCENMPPRMLRAMNAVLRKQYGYYYNSSGLINRVMFRNLRKPRGYPRNIDAFQARASLGLLPGIDFLYKKNTIAVRKAVLAGLFDRCASVTSDGEIELYVEKTIRNAVLEVVQSLGGYGYMYNCALRVGLIERIPCKVLTGYKVFPKGLRMSVTPAGRNVYFGFMLNGDGRFCLGDYTVTHNSSILQGVEFALFGTGKNLVSHGETSCSAELTVGNTVITRTKRPNRLVVATPQGNMEDDEAQAWISQRFSARASVSPFITMTPADKLVFLETTAFRNIDISRLKDLAKTRVKRTELVLAKAQQKLRTTEEFLAAAEPPGEPPEGYDSLTMKDIAKTEKRLKNARVMVTKINRSLNHYREKLQQTAHVSKEISLLESRISELEADLEKLPNNDTGSVQVRLSKTKTELNAAREYSRYLETQARCDELTAQREAEIDTHTRKLTELQTQISEADSLKQEYTDKTKELDKLDEYSGLVDKVDELTREIENKTELETQLSTIPERREKLLNNDVVTVTCPCCSQVLGYRNGALSIVQDSVETTTDTMESLRKLEKKLNRQLAGIESKEAELSRLNESIATLEPTLLSETEEVEYIARVETIEAVVQQGTTARSELTVCERTHRATMQRIETELERYANCPQIDPVESTETEIQALIDSLTAELQSCIEIDTVRRQKTAEVQSCRDKLGRLELPDSVELYESKIAELSEMLPEHERKVEMYSDSLELLRTYNVYMKTVEEYTSRQTAVSTASEELRVSEEMYSTTVAFRQKIVDAETKTLASVISTLNAYAADYLEAFFPENPIVVEILPYKESAKRGGASRKSQISTRVEYRGAEADLVSLSSGERDRVILAFSLAVHHLQSGKIVMLDECTSSLDAESSNVVFSKIKTNLEDHCVLIVAHQIVQGIFDDVLEI